MHRKPQYNNRVARKKPFMSKNNIQKRMNFAQDHIKKDFSFWNRVLYTKVSKFNVFRSDGQSYIVYGPNLMKCLRNRIFDLR